MATAALELDLLIPRWRSDPVGCIYDTFSKDLFGNPVHIDPAQIEILEAVRDHDRVAVRSGRGVGKTATAALIVHWWLATHNPGLVVASAGTWSHLEDKLWPEINAWGRAWDLNGFFEYQTMSIFKVGSRETWKAVAASSDKAVNVEGFHNPHFLLLIDEAKGMPDEIFAALLASLSGDAGPGTQKCVALSTPPTADVGWFAKACSNPRWKQVHVSGVDSPRVSSEYIEDIADTFGENSVEYQAYVLGNIPEGVTGRLIRKSWFERAQQPKKRPTRPTVITCDVARGGDDLCTIGEIRNSVFNLHKFEDTWGWFAESDLMQVVKRIGQAVRRRNAKAVCIDDTGLGGGVTDRLRELQHEGAFPSKCTIWPVNFGARPRRPDRFFRRKHEMWWSTREALRSNAIGMPTDEQIRAWRTPKGSDFKDQLLAPIYESNPKEQVIVFDKRVTGKEATKGLPLKSPDLAHALILGVDYYQRQEEVQEPPDPPTTGEEVLREMMRKQVEKQRKSRGRNPFRR